MESIHFPKPGRSVEAEGTTAWSAFAKKLSQMHRPEENATSTDAIALESLIAIRQLIMNGQDKEAHREAASMLEGSIFKAASPINRAGVLYIVGCLARYQGDLQRGQELLAKSEAELSQHWQELAESEDSAESRSDQDKQRARYRGMEMYDLLLGAREAATTGQTGHRHADIAYYSTAEAPSGLRNERHHTPVTALEFPGSRIYQASAISTVGSTPGVLPVDKLDVELPGEDDERAAHHLTLPVQTYESIAACGPSGTSGDLPEAISDYDRIAPSVLPSLGVLNTIYRHSTHSGSIDPAPAKQHSSLVDIMDDEGEDVG